MNNLHQTNQSKKIPFVDKISYGLGNFSAGVSIQVIGTFLMFYCTAVLNIPGSLVGTAVSLSILWDAITDPIMGYISDNTRSTKFGRRHLYLLIGGFGMGICNFFLWNISSGLPTMTKFIIILADILAIKTFMTIFITPYTALGAELSNDYNERTSIQAIKTIFFILGLFFVSVVLLSAFFSPTVEFPIGQLNPKAYSYMGTFSSIIVVFFAYACFYSTKKYIPLLNRTGAEASSIPSLRNLLASFKKIILDRLFRSVAFAYMFNNIASALLSNLGLHVFTYTFELSSHQIAIVVGTQFVASIISQPLWSVISRRIDKKPALNLGLGLCVVSSLYFLMLVLFKNQLADRIFFFIPFAALAGFGIGGLFSLPLSMIADIIDLEELSTKTRSEGTYYGCLTLFYKFSQSVALLFIGFVLDIIKFNADLPVQLQSTVITLGIILAAGSAISFVAALISLRPYNLDRATVEDIQKQIQDRKVS